MGDISPPHCTVEETEDQRGQATCPKSQRHNVNVNDGHKFAWCHLEPLAGLQGPPRSISFWL